MKGQKLFVRPMDDGDAAAVREFLDRESPDSPTPTAALLGKLVGDLVAIVAMQITAESVEIHDLVVARDVRKKRIGRFMIDELYALAAKMDRARLVIQCNVPDEFLRRVGFAEEDQKMVRRVAR